jgi:hypothetical protein
VAPRVSNSPGRKSERQREREEIKEEMVRTPSCDKNGLKKGTWTAEEDRKLTAYVTRYGCWNWRQLPKFAGNYIIKIFSGKAYYFQYFMKMVDSKNIHFGFHNRSPSFFFFFHGSSLTDWLFIRLRKLLVPQLLVAQIYTFH